MSMADSWETVRGERNSDEKRPGMVILLEERGRRNVEWERKNMA